MVWYNYLCWRREDFQVPGRAGRAGRGRGSLGNLNWSDCFKYSQIIGWLRKARLNGIACGYIFPGGGPLGAAAAAELLLGASPKAAAGGHWL